MTISTALSAAAGAALGTFVVGAIGVGAWVAVQPGNPTPEQVAKYTQNTGTDLYGRGIWDDSSLLDAGLVVCTAGDSSADQRRALQQWGPALDETDASTIVKGATELLCPTT